MALSYDRYLVWASYHTLSRVKTVMKMEDPYYKARLGRCGTMGG